jgi:hypothetical protein
MTYRDDLAALTARHDALATEVAQKTRELADTSRLLDDAKARLRLPVLDNIKVASPCSADWNKMTGDERARHCGDCKKNVYNLSGMTREEAEALIREKEGRLCVRYYQRKDGTILFGGDCTVGIRRKRKVRFIAGGAALMLAGAGAIVGRQLLKKTEKPEVMMGAIEVDHRYVGPIDQPQPPDDDVREWKGELVQER